MINRFALAFAVLFLIITFGCSAGGGLVISPAEAPIPAMDSATEHMLWGFFQFIADPEAQTLDIIPLHRADMHVNVLPFLEPPPLTNLTLESLKFNGNLITADIGLKHPFLGLKEFTGFDVCGIFISNGGAVFGETGLIYAGKEKDTRLLNPDGFTRWWNPKVFIADGTMFSYTDGLLGTPHSIAKYNTDLNGYKYFTDELGATDDILHCTPAKRGQFSAGVKNIRRYEISLGDDGLIFNYAVDACWKFPNGPAPWDVPDDFPPSANRQEAWAVDVNEIKNTLYNNGTASGGELTLSIDVYDHFNAGLNTIIVQSPGNFTAISSATPISGGEGYSTYYIEITNATPAAGNIPVYIVVESEETGYGGKLPGKPLSGYWIHNATVVTGNPTPEVISIKPVEALLNTGDVAAEINGTGFMPDAFAQLVKNDDPGVVLEAKDEAVNPGGTLIQCAFDMDAADGAQVGTYHVRVTNPGPPAQSGQLDNGFAIWPFSTCDKVYKDVIYEGTLYGGTSSTSTYDVGFTAEGKMLARANVAGSQLWAFDVTTNGTASGTPVAIGLINGTWATLSLDVCDLTGNIIMVNAPADPTKSENNQIIVYSSAGVYLQTIDNVNTNHLNAIDTDSDGSLWVVGHTLTPSNVYINHYKWDGTAKKYNYDAAGSIDASAQLAFDYRGIFDCAVTYVSRRLFVYLQGSPPYYGDLFCYDISTGVPVYDSTRSNFKVLPEQHGSHGYGNWHKAADIEIDHSNPALENCRILVMARNYWTIGTSFVKLNDDGKVLDSYVRFTGYALDMYDTVGLNTYASDPDGVYLVGLEDGVLGSTKDMYDVFKEPFGW